VSDRFVRDPKQMLRPGMRVQVRVLEVNLEKKQVALTMKSARVEPPRSPRRRRAAPRPRPTGSPGSARPAKPPVATTPNATRSGSRSRDGAAAGRRPRPTQARAGTPTRDAAQSAPAPKQRPTGTGVRFSNNPFAALAGLKKDLKGGDR